MNYANGKCFGRHTLIKTALFFIFLFQSMNYGFTKGLRRQGSTPAQ